MSKRQPPQQVPTPTTEAAFTRTPFNYILTNPEALPKTMAVPEAGRLYFNLGRNASYAAAARGDIPTIRIGRLLRVPVVAMERKLEASV
jgi:hypothetical protein